MLRAPRIEKAARPAVRPSGESRRIAAIISTRSVCKFPASQCRREGFVDRNSASLCDLPPEPGLARALLWIAGMAAPFSVPIDEDKHRTPIETAEIRKTPLRWIAFLVFVFVLWWAQDVVIPVVVSVLVSYALEPAVARLERWHVRRVFGVPILLAVLTMGTVGGAYALRGQATAFADRLPGAAHELARAIRKRVPGQAS